MTTPSDADDDGSLTASAHDHAQQALLGSGVQNVHFHGTGRPKVTVQPHFFLPFGRDRLFGRGEDVKSLVRIINSIGLRPKIAKPVAISGPPGVGKTALALALAREITMNPESGNIPYVDLEGWTVGRAPVSAESALANLLYLAGVPESPAVIERGKSLWATIMREREIETIVLDNVHNVRQIQPILDAISHCTVIVTSRHRLVTLYGAEHYRLDPLSSASAKKLLAEASGRSSSETSPEFERLASLVSHLPLGLQIIGARLAESSAVTESELIVELDGKQAMKALDIEDLSIEAVLDLSYRGLTQDEKHALLLIGALSSPEIWPNYLAELIQKPSGEAKRLLVGLERKNLLDTVRRNLWRMHDLIWKYTREKASSDLSAEEREVASRIPAFITSSFQPDGGGVGIAPSLEGGILVRDMKHGQGPVLEFSPDEWDVLLRRIRKHDL
ncbi:NB-ARC domain-containing protein [Nonomuraea sp. NPDC003201]